jgi:hypothetical protein
MFVVYIVKIVPYIIEENSAAGTAKTKLLRVAKASAVYVLPVIFCVGLFIYWINISGNFKDYVAGNLMRRGFGGMGLDDGKTYTKEQIVQVIYNNFVSNFSIYAVVFITVALLLFIAAALKKGNEKNLAAFYKTALMIYVPPFLHASIFRQHMAVHEFTLSKFALPCIFSVIVFVVAIARMRGWTINREKIDTEDLSPEKKCGTKAEVVILSSMVITAAALVGIINLTEIKDGYYISRKQTAPYYELAELIRDNRKYEDVYFTYTDPIPVLPPQRYSVSSKIVHSIDDFEKIKAEVDPAARFCFVMRKSNEGKHAEIIQSEMQLAEISTLYLESENYLVYDLPWK